MSEDIKQFTAPKEYDEQQGAFEQFIIDKYKQWKEHSKEQHQALYDLEKAGVDRRSEEQKAFEDYLTYSEPLKNEVKIVKHDGGNASFQQFTTYAKQRETWSISSADASAVQSQMKVGQGYIILVIEKGKISDALDTSMVVYGKYVSTNTLVNQITIDGLGYSTGVKTYSQEKIDELVKHNTPVGPTPSASINYINIDNMNRETLPPIPQNYKEEKQQQKVILGKYGLNIIDYRQLSLSPQLGLTGQYIKVLRTGRDGKEKLVQEKTGPHTIFNKYPHKNNDDHSKYTYGGTIGISGIKKDVDITFNDVWKPIPRINKEDKGQVLFRLIRETVDGGGYRVDYENVQFDEAQVESKTHTPSHHGLYQIELGTGSSGHGSLPDKYMIEFNARYGTLETKSRKRTFEFLNHNGFILKANDKLQDAYIKHPMGDVLKRKVGVVKATELEWYHGLDLIGDQAHYIYAKVPFDCKVPKTEVGRPETETESKRLGQLIMSNNLTEVDPSEHHEHLPYHKNPPYLEKYIVNLPYTHYDPAWCFILVTSPENAKRYHELLSETEITYELADEYQTVEYLKQGGFVISLTNGELIHSYDYVKIDKKEAESAYELTDVNGKKIKINMAQIVAVYPNE